MPAPFDRITSATAMQRYPEGTEDVSETPDGFGIPRIRMRSAASTAAAR